MNCRLIIRNRTTIVYYYRVVSPPKKFQLKKETNPDGPYHITTEYRGLI